MFRVIFLLIVGCAFTSPINLSGLLVDQEGEALSGFEVRLSQSGFSATTNLQGQWSIIDEGTVGIEGVSQPRFDLNNGIVRLYGWQGQKVSFDLRNSLGQIIFQSDEISVLSEIHEITIPEQANTGFYFLSLRSENSFNSYPIIQQNGQFKEAHIELPPSSLEELIVSKGSKDISVIPLNSLDSVVDITIDKHATRGFFSGVTDYDSLFVYVDADHVVEVYVDWFDSTISPISNFYTAHSEETAEYKVAIKAYHSDVLTTVGAPVTYENSEVLEANFYSIIMHNALPFHNLEIQRFVESGEEIQWVFHAGDTVGVEGTDVQIFANIGDNGWFENQGDTLRQVADEVGFLSYLIRIVDSDGTEITINDSIEVVGPQEYIFEDERDGEVYKAVKIGQQIWMAQSLRYQLNGSTCDYDCQTQGQSYNWYEVIQGDSTSTMVQGICPSGYHVPTEAEFQELADYANTYATPDTGSYQVNSLRSVRVGGSDEFDFNSIGTIFYSSTKSSNVVTTLSTTYYDNGVTLKTSSPTSDRSLRCIKDDDVIPSASYEYPDLLGANTSLVDSRDSEVYALTQIGTQVWMASNLRYVTSESQCQSNCDSEGQKYTWTDLIRTDRRHPTMQGICPDGFKVPSQSDYIKLHGYAYFNSDITTDPVSINSLKSIENGGLDEFGFNALTFSDSATWWTSDYDFDYYHNVEANVFEFGPTEFDFSLERDSLYFHVRCLKQSSDDLPDRPTLIDARDNEEYAYTVIGNQLWLSENLRYNASGSYCTGDCYFDGRLYDWPTVIQGDSSGVDVQGVCPNGFNIPTVNDWEELFDYVEANTSTDVGQALKSTLYDTSVDFLNGKDEFGFTVTHVGEFWTSELAASLGWAANSYNIFNNLRPRSSMSSTDEVFSVRCMQTYTGTSSSVDVSSSSLPDNVIYDNRDGETYEVVEIGSQTWFAENLRYETPSSECNSNCEVEGRNYTWNDLLQGDFSSDNVQGLCPVGYHVPSQSEFEALLLYVEQNVISSSWNAETLALLSVENGGDDIFGFQAMYLPTSADFWTSTASGSSEGALMSLDGSNQGRMWERSVTNLLQARCLKTEEVVLSSSSDISSSTNNQVIIDSRDGEEYTYETIGNQVWMTENLRYDNGTASCGNSCSVNGRYYDLHEALAGDTTSALNPSNVQGLCPTGWHMPSYDEFEELRQYAIANASNQNWNAAASALISVSEGGTNELGFNSLLTTDTTANYWTVTGNKWNTSAYFTLDGGQEPYIRQGGYISEMAIRCVQGAVNNTSSSVEISSSDIISSSSSISVSSSSSTNECQDYARQGVNANSVEDGTTFYASRAIDGSTVTRWSSDYDKNQWITVDLGSIQSVDRVIVQWDEAHATDYTIRYSPTGSDGSFLTADEYTNWSGGEAVHDFADIDARYIGIEMTDGVLFTGTFYGYSIQEIEVYGDCNGQVGGNSSSVIVSSSSEQSSSSTFDSEGRIIGYLPDYRPLPTDDQLDRLTHIMAFSGEPTSTGSFDHSSIDGAQWNIDSLVSRSHAKSVKVLVSLGGAGRSDYFASVTTSSSLRAKFIGEVMDYVRLHNLDGVDVDWEFPQSSSEFQGYKDLLHDFRDSLGTEAQLSIAVGGTSQHESPGEFTSGTFTVLDWVGLMSYDYWYNNTNSGNEVHSSINLVNQLTIWDNYMDKDQVVLGVPFYGRGDNAWGTAETYANIIGSSTYSGDSYGGYNYNGTATIDYKSDYSFQNSYGGIMIWEVGQDVAATDSRSLLNTIWNSRVAEYGSEKN